MIAIVMTHLASVVSAATFAASDDSSPTWLLALGPVGGGAVYFGMWRYYRNTHVSHSYESETRVAAQPATGDDAKVKSITGTKKTRIDGDNRTSHRQRVQRLE